MRTAPSARLGSVGLGFDAAFGELRLNAVGTDEVADVTGAGDTVLAVLTASLAAWPTDGATASI